MKTSVFILGVLVGLIHCQPADAESMHRTVQRLQDRFNQSALTSVLGAVDYEFVYASSSRDLLLFLEEEETPAPRDTLAATRALISALEAQRDSLERAGVPVPLWLTQALDPQPEPVAATRDSLGTLGVRPSFESLPLPEEPSAPPELTRESLPEELRQADLTALKAQYPPPPELTDRSVRLAVRPVAENPRFGGERLSLAEEELSMMERRQLRWKFRRLMQHWPVGSILFLDVAGEEPSGETAEIPLQWSFRRPGPPPFDRPEVIASGKLPLAFKRVGEEWKVSHIEQLIAAISEEVVLK